MLTVRRPTNQPNRAYTENTRPLTQLPPSELDPPIGWHHSYHIGTPEKIKVLFYECTFYCQISKLPESVDSCDMICLTLALSVLSPAGYSGYFWVGVCRLNSDTLTLY